jgi:hypothetical protein
MAEGFVAAVASVIADHSTPSLVLKHAIRCVASIAIAPNGSSLRLRPSLRMRACVRAALALCAVVRARDACAWRQRAGACAGTVTDECACVPGTLLCAAADNRRVLVESTVVSHLQRIGVDTRRMEEEAASGLKNTCGDLARAAIDFIGPEYAAQASAVHRAAAQSSRSYLKKEDPQGDTSVGILSRLNGIVSGCLFPPAPLSLDSTSTGVGTSTPSPGRALPSLAPSSPLFDVASPKKRAPPSYRKAADDTASPTAVHVALPDLRLSKSPSWQQSPHSPLAIASPSAAASATRAPPSPYHGGGVSRADGLLLDPVFSSHAVATSVGRSARAGTPGISVPMWLELESRQSLPLRSPASASTPSGSKKRGAGYK